MVMTAAGVSPIVIVINTRPLPSLRKLSLDAVSGGAEEGF